MTYSIRPTCQECGDVHVAHQHQASHAALQTSVVSLQGDEGGCQLKSFSSTPVKRRRRIGGGGRCRDDRQGGGRGKGGIVWNKRGRFQCVCLREALKCDGYGEGTKRDRHWQGME